MDTAKLHSTARGAEARYERLARWLAPTTWRGSSGRCDEVVGRFCLTFDTLSKPPKEPERRQVGEARAEALARLQAYAAQVPGDVRSAGPLVRLLVESGQAEEAVLAAARFAAWGSDRQWGDWLTGYALHAAGRDSAAAERFHAALARASERERARIESLEWLLSAAEWKRVQSLPDSARAAYRDWFWRVSDPMWQTAVSETWVAHVARHVEVLLLERVPLVPGMMSWGDDLAELTVRYGRPIARERDLASSSERVAMIEHFDTTALAYAPQALLGDGLPAAAPGERWALKEPRARSSHSVPSIAHAYPLEHQLTRIPRGERMVLQLAARVAPDSGGSPGSRALLSARTWRGGEERSARAELAGAGAGLVELALEVPRDSLLVSAEVFDPATRTLHLVRQLLEPLPGGAIQLSDILLTEPLPPGDSAAGDQRALPLTSQLLPNAGQLGVRVEVQGVGAGETMDVEVSFVRANTPSVLARAIGWAGRRLGLASGAAAPPRVRWQATAGDPAVIQVNLGLPARAGDYFVAVLVRTRGVEVTTTRLVRVLSEAES